MHACAETNGGRQWNAERCRHTGIQIFLQNRAPPACTNLQYFSSNYLEKQLFVCCMSVGLCQSAAKGKGKGEKTKQKNKNQKKKKTKKNRLVKVTKIGFLGVSFFFWFFIFVFLVFLVSWFLVFWFVAGFLKGWQNNTKVKDLDLTLCQFSHFRGCKLAFGWFYWLLWACGSIGKPCKKPWQNAGITGGSLGGLGHRLGNFVCLCNFSKTVLN